MESKNRALELDVYCTSAWSICRFDDLDVMTRLACPPRTAESAVARSNHE
jgi:hypothetical protein